MTEVRKTDRKSYDCDSLYYLAIERAQNGEIEPSCFEALSSEAGKYAQLNMLEESARHYERLYQIVKGSIEHGYKPSPSQTAYLIEVLQSYAGLLDDLSRDERKQVVLACISDLKGKI